MNLKDKRFLITHSVFQRFMGSSVVALELAQYLKRSGAEVLIYTNFVGEPLKSILLDEEIAYLTSDSRPELSLKDFDYVWVQSQVIPQSFINELKTITSSSSLPIFLFNHMNKNDDAADERPFIWGLEESLSSLSLFVSGECRDTLKKYFPDGRQLSLFCNPAPVEYSAFEQNSLEKLSKILIVSNHVPSEILEAKLILESKDFVVDLLGQSNLSTKKGLVTPELLADYDLVISIGKTVQYCLTAGKVAYVYDWFGGVGYLNDENITTAAYVNFSGREARGRKSTEVIVEDIITNYSAASKYVETHREQFIQKYSIDHVLNDVLESVSRIRIKNFDSRFAQTLIDVQEFSNRHWWLWGWAYDEETEIAELHKQREQAQRYIDGLHNQRQETQSYIEELQQKINEKGKAYQALENDYLSVRSSSLRYILRVIKQKVKDFFKGKRN